MPIPDFQSIMLPLLDFLRDQKEHSSKEIIEGLSDYFKLINYVVQFKFKD
jgi:restriction system protein